MVAAAVGAAAAQGRAIRCSTCSADLGNFTLPLAGAPARVVGVEGDPALVAKARANAGAQRHRKRGILRWIISSNRRIAAPGAHAAYDLVLLDPPRAGARCNPGTHGTMAAAPSRVYFLPSGSLARDAGILTRVHGLQLIGAGVMDMFPHTTHVESIAVFERVRMSLGPLMIDVAGTELSSEDRDVLRHPLVGSVLLFSRNYRNPQQLARAHRGDSGSAHAALADRGRPRGRPRTALSRRIHAAAAASRLLGRRFDEDRARRACA